MSLHNRMLYVGVLFAGLVGCPEPGDATTTGSEAGAEPDGDPNANGNDGSNEPQPFSNPNDARFSVSPGEGVTLKGVFQYEGDITGSYRIDVQKQQGSAPPMLVHAIELEQPGEFSIEVPKAYGSISLVGFVDAKSDGPTPDDPVGRTTEPLLIEEANIEGIVLAVALGNELNTAPPEPGKGPTAGEPSNAGSPEEGAPDGSPPPEQPPADG